VYHRLAEDEKFKEYRELFISILDEKDAPYILADELAFDNKEPEYFEDMNHMSAKGRRVYTKELIRLLEGRKDS